MTRPRLPIGPSGLRDGALEEPGPQKPRRLILTATDVELFRWLWMLRVMTLGQLRRVGYYQPDSGLLSSLHNVRKRLRRLWHEGYLLDDRLATTHERIYFLGERALRSLRERYGITQRRLYQPRGLETMRQVHHALLVSECAVRVVESVRGSAIQVPNLAPLEVPFYHTHAVGDPRKKKHIDRFVTQEDLIVPGHVRPLRVRPDLAFALSQEQITRLYFLEADRGSESARQIAAKQLAYHHFRQAPDPTKPGQYLWQRYGTVRDFRILFVTTTARRAGNLAKSLSDQPGFGLMAFSAVDDVKQHNMIFDGIWTNRQGKNRALARRTEAASSSPTS